MTNLLIAAQNTVQIPSSYVAAILPAAFLSLASLIAFLFRQNARSNEALATVAQQVKDMERRTTRVEDVIFNGRGRMKVGD